MLPGLPTLAGGLAAGAGGALPGLAGGGASPAPDASAIAASGSVAPTLQQQFGSGTFYARSAPVQRADLSARGGQAAAGAGLPAGMGAVTPLTAGDNSNTLVWAAIIGVAALVLIAISRR